MSFRYLWLDLHRRAVEIGPLDDGSYVYFADTFIQCHKIPEGNVEVQLKVEGGVSLCEIPLSSSGEIQRYLEVLIDEEYGIVQVISIELKAKERIDEEKLKEEVKSAEEEIREACLSSH
jgi:hypothetical protein